MNKSIFEKLFSPDRAARYFDRHPGDDATAMTHYRCNMEISEAFYPVLSTLEVALRNCINRQLTLKFGSPDWYSHFPTTPGLHRLVGEISKSQSQIAGRGELISPPKVVAELTLGFWVRLFNAEFERTLWKELRLAFPYIPKHLRQRKNISAPLNRFRHLRNRIFHNEPICWNLPVLKSHHSEMVEIMNWLNPNLPKWLIPSDRFDTVLAGVAAKI